ncbi:hypothetical protein KM043_002770 [Ampulex compressa]|nr:hypothetical protein KM043_002770 [Ampulex compressa]
MKRGYGSSSPQGGRSTGIWTIGPQDVCAAILAGPLVPLSESRTGRRWEREETNKGPSRPPKEIRVRTGSGLQWSSSATFQFASASLRLPPPWPRKPTQSASSSAQGRGQRWPGRGRGRGEARSFFTGVGGRRRRSAEHPGPRGLALIR